MASTNPSPPYDVGNVIIPDNISDDKLKSLIRDLNNNKIVKYKKTGGSLFKDGTITDVLFLKPSGWDIFGNAKAESDAIKSRLAIRICELQAKRAASGTKIKLEDLKDCDKLITKFCQKSIDKFNEISQNSKGFLRTKEPGLIGEEANRAKTKLLEIIKRENALNAATIHQLVPNLVDSLRKLKSFIDQNKRASGNDNLLFTDCQREIRRLYGSKNDKLKQALDVSELTPACVFILKQIGIMRTHLTQNSSLDNVENGDKFKFHLKELVDYFEPVNLSSSITTPSTPSPTIAQTRDSSTTPATPAAPKPPSSSDQSTVAQPGPVVQPTVQTPATPAAPELPSSSNPSTVAQPVPVAQPAESAISARPSETVVKPTEEVPPEVSHTVSDTPPPVSGRVQDIAQQVKSTTEQRDAQKDAAIQAGNLAQQTLVPSSTAPPAPPTQARASSPASISSTPQSSQSPETPPTPSTAVPDEVLQTPSTDQEFVPKPQKTLLEKFQGRNVGQQRTADRLRNQYEALTSGQIKTSDFHQGIGIDSQELARVLKQTQDLNQEIVDQQGEEFDKMREEIKSRLVQLEEIRQYVVGR